MLWTRRRLKKLFCLSKQKGNELVWSRPPTKGSQFILLESNLSTKPFKWRKQLVIVLFLFFIFWQVETTSYSWGKIKDKEKNKEEYMLHHGIKSLIRCWLLEFSLFCFVHCSSFDPFPTHIFKIVLCYIKCGF